MAYKDRLATWYDLTLELLCLRLSEELNKNITVADLNKAFQKKYGHTDNTQTHELLFKEGLMLFNELKTHQF